MIKLYRDILSNSFIIEKETYEYTTKLLISSHNVLSLVSHLYNLYINANEYVLYADDLELYQNKEDNTVIIKKDTSEGFIALVLTITEVKQLIDLLIKELEGENISYIIKIEEIPDEIESEK